LSDDGVNNRSPPLPGIVRVTRRQIAEWQIDNAILVWFQDAEDVVSPHTLTLAAQGVLTAPCRDMRKPVSKVVTWISQQSKSFQEQIRNPQNFFKHGYHKQRFKDVASFTPEMTEMFLIDNIAVYQELFGVLTIPMIIFALRFSLTHPRGLPLVAFKFADQESVQATEVEKLRGLNRKEFFLSALSLVSKRRTDATE
jgi:hypothetical protein